MGATFVFAFVCVYVFGIIANFIQAEYSNYVATFQ